MSFVILDSLQDLSIKGLINPEQSNKTDVGLLLAAVNTSSHYLIASISPLR